MDHQLLLLLVGLAAVVAGDVISNPHAWAFVQAKHCVARCFAPKPLGLSIIFISDTQLMPTFLLPPVTQISLPKSRARLHHRREIPMKECFERPRALCLVAAAACAFEFETLPTSIPMRRVRQRTNHKSQFFRRYVTYMNRPYSSSPSKVPSSGSYFKSTASIEARALSAYGACFSDFRVGMAGPGHVRSTRR